LGPLLECLKETSLFASKKTLSDQKVFLRNATGLRREFGVLDAIWINLSLVGIIFSLTFISSTAPLVGGDPLTVGLLALVAMFFVSLVFSIVSIITPRTAGDYVFTSRYLHPALGFVGNAGYYVATVPLFMGITITTIESFGFSGLFAYLGLVWNNPGLLSLASTLTVWYNELALGGILTVVFGLLPFFGYRIYKSMHKVILPLILIGVAVMFAVLATTSQADAISKISTLYGVPNIVQNVTSIANSTGYTPPAPHGLYNGYALNAVYVVGFSYIISAIYVAGEVKQIKRNMPLAIIGTLIITLVIFAGATILSYHTFGYNFLSNLYYNAIDTFKYPGTVPVVPYLNFLAASISPNVYVGSFIIIVSIIQLLWYQTNAVFIGGRLLLSYSLDRIMPSFMGDVSSGFHVPSKAMIVSLIIGLLAGVIFTVPSAISAAAFLMSDAAVAIILLFPIFIVGVALLVYRFKHAAEFKSSAIANTYLGGPLFYIACIVTIVYSLATFYAYVTVPALFGFAGTEGLELLFGPIIILFAIYYISKYVNGRRGVAFDKIFKEIPPE
jgi:glutamate:GABA antiporter